MIVDRRLGHSGHQGIVDYVFRPSYRGDCVCRHWTACATVHAEVASVEVTERHLIEDGRTFGTRGAYEEIVARVTFAIDPANPLNQVIVGLDRAPRNPDGLVEATADLVILALADRQRGNGVALVDIASRERQPWCVLVR